MLLPLYPRINPQIPFGQSVETILSALEKKKISCIYWQSNQDSSAAQPVA
jgi:hypothetical protein